MSKEIIHDNSDTFSTDYSDIDCPYCGVSNDIEGHEELLYSDDEGFEHVCWDCDETWIVIPSVSWSWTAYKSEEPTHE